MRSTRTDGPHRVRTPGVTRAGPRGFTLIELLIVVGIIVLLIAMSVVVGTKVVEGGRARATQNVIRTLDESLGAWTLNADSPLPAELRFYDGQPGASTEYVYPLVDGTLVGGNIPVGFPTSPWPSVTFYTALAMQDTSVEASLKAIDSTFVDPSQAPPANVKTGNVDKWAISAVRVTDAWGRPIRIVHPAYHGGHGEYWDPKAKTLVAREPLRRVQFSSGRGALASGDFRRSYRPFKDDQTRKPGDVGDADEGMCIGGTPYFYSAGADGDPGTREDNVYSTVPRFPVETRDFK